MNRKISPDLNESEQTPAADRYRRRDLAVRLRCWASARRALRVRGRDHPSPLKFGRRADPPAVRRLRAGVVQWLGGKGKRIPPAGTRLTRPAPLPTLRSRRRAAARPLEAR